MWPHTGAVTSWMYPRPKAAAERRIRIGQTDRDVAEGPSVSSGIDGRRSAGDAGGGQIGRAHRHPPIGGVPRYLPYEVRAALTVQATYVQTV